MASVNPSEIFIYGSANMPENNTGLVGGVVDTTKKIGFTDLTIPSTLNYVSMGGTDTTTILVMTGRDVTGAIVSETVTLNGTTPIVGTQSFERLLYSALSGATAGGPIANPGGINATGDVAAYGNIRIANHTLVSYTPSSGAVPPLLQLATGDGATCPPGTILRAVAGPGANVTMCYVIDNTRYSADVVAINRNLSTAWTGATLYNAYQGMFFDFLPNPVRAVIRAFSTTNANASITDPVLTYYEKVFVMNNDTLTALTSSVVTLQSEVGALPGTSSLQIGLTTTQNDSSSIANRQAAAPVGVTFTTGPAPQSQPVPGLGNLPSGAAPNAAGAQGVWLRLILPGGTSPYKGVADLRVTGVTA